MPLITELDVGKLLGYAYFGLVIALAAEMLIILAMHFLMPKAILTRYWKAPHFQPYELAAYTGTLLAPMRTIMLMGAITFSRLGGKRNLVGIQAMVPAWYRLSATITVGWIIMCGVAIAAIVLGTGFYLHTVGEIGLWPTGEGPPVDWGMAAAMGIVMAGCIFMLAKIFSRKRASRSQKPH